MAADSISSVAPRLRAVVAGVTAAAVFASVIVQAAGRAQHDPDVLSALSAVRTRAESGDAVAQVTLAAFLEHAGEGTEAVDWYLRAARSGHRDAQYQAGERYTAGRGVSGSVREGIAWYRRAADQGSVAAQRRLGDAYRRGMGVEVDVGQAVTWYRRAAEGDDLRAQYALGDLYLNGAGMDADPAEAYVWFALAASQTPLVDNWKALIELRNIAGARMEPGEREAADRRLEAWRPVVWTDPSCFACRSDGSDGFGRSGRGEERD